MSLDSAIMPAGDNPPPYSTVAATPESLDSSDTELPFVHSDRLAASVRALIPEGNALYLRFRHIRDVASAGAEFAYQEPAFSLSRKFETLIWESRNIAGIAFAAIKDFNEIILDFLSEPDAAVQDQLKELNNASKVLQRERDSAVKHKSSFDALIKALDDYHRLIHSESGALIPTRRHRQSESRGKGGKGPRPSRKSKSPYVLPRSEPRNGVSSVTASIGAFTRTSIDYALHFERIAEKTVFPWCISSPPDVQETSPVTPNAEHGPSERDCLFPPSSIGPTEVASLPGLVDTLVHDLRAFASRADILNNILEQLAREQSIFFVYLEDGQSIANPAYRSEINRLRRQLPCLCSAVDDYSKARLL